MHLFYIKTIQVQQRHLHHQIPRKYVFFVFVYSKKWVHSRIGQCVRPAVRPSGRLHDNYWKANPIVVKFCTQHYLINISLEFEDENNSSRIYLFTARNIIIFYSLLCKYWPIPIFANQNFCHSQNETSTIIYHSIENFMGYKMMLNYRGKYVALKISSMPQYPKTMKNSYILTVCLCDMYLFPIELKLLFWSR